MPETVRPGARLLFLMPRQTTRIEMFGNLGRKSFLVEEEFRSQAESQKSQRTHFFVCFRADILKRVVKPTRASTGQLRMAQWSTSARTADTRQAMLAAISTIHRARYSVFKKTVIEPC
jgi:hypothetical protein